MDFEKKMKVYEDFFIGNQSLEIKRGHFYLIILWTILGELGKTQFSLQKKHSLYMGGPEKDRWFAVSQRLTASLLLPLPSAWMLFYRIASASPTW
jgi:hypothetical protein